MKTTSPGTTTDRTGRTDDDRLRHPGNSPVFTESFRSAMSTPEENKKLVEIKAPHGLVDMFGRPYPRKLVVWVHHFDDYGVLVEGTYDILLARRALKKAGYDPGDAGCWGYRPTLVGQEPRESGFGGDVSGRPCVAFYFDVGASLG